MCDDYVTVGLPLRLPLPYSLVLLSPTLPLLPPVLMPLPSMSKTVLLPFRLFSVTVSFISPVAVNTTVSSGSSWHFPCRSKSPLPLPSLRIIRIFFTGPVVVYVTVTIPVRSFVAVPMTLTVTTACILAVTVPTIDTVTFTGPVVVHVTVPIPVSSSITVLNTSNVTNRVTVTVPAIHTVVFPGRVVVDVAIYCSNWQFRCCSSSPRESP